MDVLNEMKNNNFQVIYPSTEQALSRDFLRLLRDESTALKRQLSLIVVDESHTVETWLFNLVIYDTYFLCDLLFFHCGHISFI